ALCNFDRQMSALNRSDAADETQVRMLGLSQAVLREIDAVVNRAQTKHGFLTALEFADAHVMHVGILPVEFAQFRIVSAVQRADNGSFNKTRAGQTLGRLQMNNVAGLRRVLPCPGCVMQLLQPSMVVLLDWPLWALIDVTTRDVAVRFSVRV